MPFRYDLHTIQKCKKWTSRETENAKTLQRLFDAENAEAYAEQLAAFRQEIASDTMDSRDRHDFLLTDGKIYEIFDEGEIPAVIEHRQASRRFHRRVSA